MKTNDTQNNAQHLERAPGSAAPRHQHPAHPCVCWRGGAVSLQSESGEGRELEPADDGKYYISTAEQLKEFADKVNDGETDANTRAELTDDIDLSSVCGPELNDGSSVSWTPIGSDSRPYRGTFDGDGHTISGLYITSTADYQGLFGYVGTGGTVKDLTVSGTVSGGMYVGGVVGQNDGGSITNCAFSGSGSVSGSDHVGGVVGDNSGIVTNCYNTGSVSGSEYVGGVVGYNSGSVNVENCYNTGTVTGPDSGTSNSVGGVVGYNSGIVTNCYNTGAVSGGEYVGGVVGYNYIDGSVTNSYNTGEVSGNISGGVVGNNYGSASVINCYNTGSVKGDWYVGGVVGENSGNGNVTGCYFLKDTAEKGIGSGNASADAKAVDDLNALCEKFKDDPWSIHLVLGRPVLQENPEGGLGTEASPYEISTADELKNFATAVNGGEKSAHAKLMNDIDLKDVCGESNSWIPIGTNSNEYTGTFNGNGNTIENLYINNTTNDYYQGLFGFVGSEGTVQNLSVSGSVKGDWYVGGVVGYNNGGTVTGCTFSGSGSVSGVLSVGGVVGNNDNSGSVENCYNTGTGTVTSGDYAGGVVGYNNGGTVENCYNTGEVTGRATVGGVVGNNDNSGTVENCYNTGEVTGRRGVGGVVGYNDSSASVTNCYFLKTADVNENLSGIGSDKPDASGKTEAKSLDDFQSGEVAYLLQKGQKAAEGGVVPLVWGQSNLGETTSLPTLVALDEEAAQPVYKVTLNWNDNGATADKISYTNGSVTFPADSEIPTRTGYTLTGWQNEDGQAVTEPITVTADTTYTAEWTVNTYTITVTAGSGGTVSGGGSVTHGDSVEVTATANQGYHFVNWTENGTIVSTETTFTFTATANRTLTANFAADAVDPDPTPTPTPDPEPSGPSTGDSTGWDDIRDELENAAKGDQITIDMGDETKVPAEIFESLAGKDVEISFDLGDIQWSVNGADIPTDTDFTDLDLGASLGTSGIPVNVINTIIGEVGTVQITLAHNGEFGFTMTLTAPLGKENAGYWANLYHYDESAEALNFEAAAKIDEDGSVTIPFSHASQYAIVIDTHSHATVDVSDLFIDIAPNAWYKDAVQYAYDNGLMTGVSATEFAPEATTTRAMIVSILARLENVTRAESAGFNDVNDEWYATAVNWAANVGVVNGYEDGTFKPNDAITREQLAAILMNYAACIGQDVSNRADLTSYTDQPSTWAEETMQWAVAEGLISGVTADTLQPQGSATRAQVAAILQRFLCK